MMRIIWLLLCMFQVEQCISQWSALQGGFDYPGRVFYYDSTNASIIVGGNFVHTDTLLTNGIANWNGTSWSKYDSGAPYGAPVYALTKYQDTLYASSVFGVPNPDAHWFYKWNGISWDSITPNLNSPIIAFKEIGGLLYIGGTFTHLGNNVFNLFGIYNQSNFTPISVQSSFGSVNAIEEFNNKIYIAGNFYDSLIHCNDILIWDGSQFSSFGGGGTSSGFDMINSMTVYNSELYIAGSFSKIGNCIANNIAKWNGTNFISLGSGTDGTILRIHAYNDGLYVCGGFTNAGGVNVSGIAKWNGSQWLSVCPNFSANAIADLIKVGNDLYLTGGFDTINSVTCNYIVKYSLPTDLGEISANEIIILQDRINERMEIINPNNKKLRITIFNIFGELVYETNTQIDEYINLSNFSSDIYIVQARYDNNTITKKFVKE